MKQRKQTAILSKKNYKISLAVRYKFFFLLLLTLALMFDTVSRQSSPELFDNRALPEVPAAR